MMLFRRNLVSNISTNASKKHHMLCTVRIFWLKHIYKYCLKLYQCLYTNLRLRSGLAGSIKDYLSFEICVEYCTLLHINCIFHTKSESDLYLYIKIIFIRSVWSSFSLQNRYFNFCMCVVNSQRFYLIVQKLVWNSMTQ